MATKPSFEDTADIVIADEVDEDTATTGSGGTDIVQAIQNLNNPSTVGFNSLPDGDFEAQMLIAEALTSSVPISENLNKQIDLVHVIIKPITMTNEKTGAVEEVPRIILIDADGVAYHAISKGLFMALDNLLSAVKHPRTWTRPIPILINKVRGAAGFYFTISFPKK